MRELLRRLKLHMLKAKLALYRMERASVEARVASGQYSGNERLQAIRRLANIDSEIRAIHAAIQELFQGNGHE